MKKAIDPVKKRRKIIPVLFLICTVLIATGLLLSCGAAVDVGQADKVLTRFEVVWPVGFDFTIPSASPVQIVVKALDQYDNLFNWSGQVSFSLDDPSVSVNPLALNITNGSALQSIAFYNLTDENHDTELTVSYPGVSSNAGVTITVYETNPPAAVDPLNIYVWDRSIKLTWVNPSDTDFAGVKVVRKTGGYPDNVGDGTVVYNGTAMEYVNKYLSNGTDYYYKVYAYDEGENYANGVPASGTPEDHSISIYPPFVENHKVTLRWPEDTDADYYEAYYTADGSVPNEGNGTKVSSISTEFLELDGLDNFTTGYKFRLYAVKEGMLSQPSGTVRAMPPGKIADHKYHCLAVCADGTVMAWGKNDNGEIGDGTKTDRQYPVKVVTETDDPLTNVVSVAVGYYHSLALLSNGQVRAWGYNYFGQVGDGSVLERLYPVDVRNETDTGPLENVVAIAAGGDSSYALLSDGTVVAWGRNSSYQLGDGTNSQRELPVEVKLVGDTLLDRIVAIGAGESFAAALREEGNVVAWGDGGYGVLGQGYGDYQDKGYAIPVKNQDETGYLENVAAINCGLRHTLALLNDDTLVGWGTNSYGELGMDYSGSIATPWPFMKDADTVLTDVLSVSCAWYHTVVILKDNTIHACGWNNEGSLGQGTSDSGRHDYPEPVTLDGSTPVTGVHAAAAGVFCNFAILDDGSTLSWGSNGFGELGDGSFTDRYSAVPVDWLWGDTISAGGSHSLRCEYATTEAKAWGENGSGQLSDDTTVDRTSAVSVKQDASTILSGVEWIEGGGGHTLILMDDTSVKACGKNDLYQLGLGSTGNKDLPISVKDEPGTGTLQNILAVSAGGDHSIALESDNSVLAWGSNQFCQLGDGNDLFPPPVGERPQEVKADSSGPPFDPLTDITSISAGGQHSLALTSAEGVVSWGDNIYGQAGIGTSGKDYRLVPLAVDVLTAAATPLADAIAVAAGGAHSLALVDPDDDGVGTVYAWGFNESGQLGDGSTGMATYAQPVKIDASNTLDNAVAIAAGENHSLALLDDGSVAAWGNNGSGRLGDGTASARYYPVYMEDDAEVPLSGVKEIAAGNSHSVVLLEDGTIRACGYNASGQLGDGSTSPSAVTVISYKFSLGWEN